MPLPAPVIIDAIVANPTPATKWIPDLIGLVNLFFVSSIPATFSQSLNLMGDGLNRLIPPLKMKDSVQGTIYPALLRLEQRDWIKAEWGTSESNRRARFYSLTRIGRSRIAEETRNWKRVAETMALFLAEPK